MARVDIGSGAIFLPALINVEPKTLIGSTQNQFIPGTVIVDVTHSIRGDRDLNSHGIVGHEASRAHYASKQPFLTNYFHDQDRPIGSCRLLPQTESFSH